MQHPKRRILFTLLLLCTASSVFAQIKIGALGGLNSTNLFGDTPKDAKYQGKIGIYSGLYFDFYVHKNVAISVQTAFSQEGAKLLYNVPGAPQLVDSGTVNFQYIRIPVLAKINANNNRFYALAGFDFGILNSASFKLNNQPDEDIHESLSKNDLSFQTGIGYRWYLKNLVLFLEGRYTIGLENLTHEPVEDINYFPRVKNSSFKILFGLEIPLWTPNGKSELN